MAYRSVLLVRVLTFSLSDHLPVLQRLHTGRESFTIPLTATMKDMVESFLFHLAQVFGDFQGQERGSRLRSRRCRGCAYSPYD